MRRIITALSALVVALVGVIALVAPASAHVPWAGADCQALSVDLVKYNDKGTNHVTVTIDGTAVYDEDFGTSFVQDFTFDDETVAHTWKVEVTAWDDPQGKSGWTRTFEGASEPCIPEPGPNFLETSHTVQCGVATITLRNVSPWIYPVSVEIDGVHSYGPVVDNRTDGGFGGPQKDQSATRTITFDEDSGLHTVRYRVQAGSESDLYQGKPVGQWTEFTVESDCIEPPPACAANLFDGYEDRGGLWEVTYGMQHTDTNGVPVFTNDSYGGLVAFNGSTDLPAYMGNPGDEYRWLYVYGDTPGNAWTWDFADGTRVTATVTYTEVGCPQIEWTYGTTPPPPPPATPEPKVTEWVGPWLCGDTTVIETRQVTTYAEPTWDGEQWVEDAEGTTVTEERTRDLTEDEQFDCPLPPKPDDKVTNGEWSQWAWECGDDEATRTRTVTTESYSFDYEAGQWVITASSQVVQTDTRPLSAEELDQCVSLPQPPALASTGLDATGIGWIIVGLLGAGVFLYAWATRRRDQ